MPTVAAGVLLLGLAIATAGTSSPQGGGDAPRQAARAVAVTIDDVPGVPPAGGCLAEPALALNRRLVDTLVAHGVPATGFVVAGRVCDGLRDAVLPDLLTAWIDAGLELGNHTFSHPDLNATRVEAFTADLVRGEHILRPVLAARGRARRFFRYPQLHTGDTSEKRRAVASFLAARGYRNAPVTLDNQEWVFAAAYRDALARGDSAGARCVARGYVPFMEAVTAFFERRVREVLGYEPPQILLIHANELNADHLPALLAMFRARGYRFVSLERALADSAYAVDDRYVGPRGLSWIHRWAVAKGLAVVGEPREPDWLRDAAAGRTPAACAA